MTEKELRTEVERLRELNASKDDVINQLQTQVGYLKVEREDLRYKLGNTK